MDEQLAQCSTYVWVLSGSEPQCTKKINNEVGKKNQMIIKHGEGKKGAVALLYDICAI